MSSAIEQTWRNKFRIDLRRRRAEALAAAVLQQLPRDIDPDRWRRDVWEALIAVFMREGVEVLTDGDREAAGLPPRGPEGWTPDELAAIERRRLELLSPLPVTGPLRL